MPIEQPPIARASVMFFAHRAQAKHAALAAAATAPPIEEVDASALEAAAAMLRAETEFVVGAMGHARCGDARAG